MRLCRIFMPVVLIVQLITSPVIAGANPDEATAEIELGTVEVIEQREVFPYSHLIITEEEIEAEIPPILAIC